jgi:hypothetical protein
MAWVNRTMRRVVSRITEALTEVAEMETPAPAPPSWTPPAFGYGDQLIPPWERARRWKAHAERQAREALEEQEQRRQLAEQFERERRQSPAGVYFPATRQEMRGVAGLVQVMDDMVREGTRRP